jgi:hypothetical protein
LEEAVDLSYDRLLMNEYGTIILPVWNPQRYTSAQGEELE